MPAPSFRANAALQRSRARVPDKRLQDVKEDVDDEAMAKVRMVLRELDERLTVRLATGDIRLLRVSWLQNQDKDYRIQTRQELEAVEAASPLEDEVPGPLLSPEEAVKLIRDGKREGAPSHRLDEAA